MMQNTPHTQPVRLLVVLGVLGAITLLLVWRALDLQILSKDFLQDQGDARHLREVATPAHRGMIADRNGEPLAISTPVDSVWANPQELLAARAQWPRLARLLNIDAKGLERHLTSRVGREFVYLKRNVSPDMAEQVMALGVPGISLQRGYRRYYPAGEVAAHVVGFTNVDDTGQEGLELAYDEWLHGIPGSKRVIKDRLGRVVENVERVSEPLPGKDVALSIDRRLQYLAYRELKAAIQSSHARSGSVVMLDVNTGEVLALVNQPSFNPNNRANLRGDDFRNRGVTDVFEPGSTIKPFTVAAALETGKFRPTTMIDTGSGLFKVGNHTVRDVHNYGVIDVSTVIQKSSNVGATKMALAMEPKQLWSMFSRVGFGAASGGRFPGEMIGALSGYEGWGEVERATLSYGYGLSVTPLQLARAYMVLADGGQFKPVSFVHLAEPPQGEQVMRPEIAGQVLKMMEAVVNTGGTGLSAGVPGYRVAGKTGTVHKSQAGGYAANRYLALFAGMAPVSKPRLVMVVMINEPSSGEYYGGLVAAPVFGRIMAGALRLLDVAPDDVQSLRTQLVQGDGVNKNAAGVAARAMPVQSTARQAHASNPQPKHMAGVL
ncbi:MAG: penicillin-binding protein 2 [Gammaproteobacteria bacterium]|nr:penicillin-binding protein 2 [Gammaproteobacteria bacterium]